MFRDREQAGELLAARLRGRVLRDPLVLAIPRGGVVTGAALARGLGADLDVVLSRKLRAPGCPELALGAVSEEAEVYLNPRLEEEWEPQLAYLARECRLQLGEIRRRQRLYRAVRPRAPIHGRTVLLTDDGIATGATAIAALHILRGHGAHELIVAVPVVLPGRLADVRACCDEVVCLLAPKEAQAISLFYQDFAQVSDAEVVKILRAFAPAAPRPGRGRETEKV